MQKLTTTELSKTNGGLFKGCRYLKVLAKKAAKAGQWDASLDFAKEWSDCKSS